MESEKKIRQSNSLRTDDIEGAKPFVRSSMYINKPSFINSNVGIDKSCPQPVSLQTARHVNPLNPDYKLPSAVLRPYTPPKFIRDTLDTSDISGKKKSVLKNSRSTLDVSDISVKTRFETKRTTNPLDPEYVIRDDTNKIIKYGSIQGACPKNFVDIKTPAHNRTLDVSDIQGNTPKQNLDSSFHKPTLKINNLKIAGFSRELVRRSTGELSSRQSISGLDKNTKISPVSYSLNASNSPKSNCNTTRDSIKTKKKTLNVLKRPLPKSPIFSPKTSKK
jgi:hypothetical protein